MGRHLHARTVKRRRLALGVVAVAALAAGTIGVSAGDTPGSKPHVAVQAAAVVNLLPRTTSKPATRSFHRSPDCLDDNCPLLPTASPSAPPTAVAKTQTTRTAPTAGPTTRRPTSNSGGSTYVGPVPASCNSYSGNQLIGCTLLVAHGWGMGQMPCLVNLWNKESGWRVSAANPSGAYGIPQALPGKNMSSYGSDWETNPVTQIKWGLGYIAGRYTTPCGAWGFWQAHNWY